MATDDVKRMRYLALATAIAIAISANLHTDATATASTTLPVLAPEPGIQVVGTYLLERGRSSYHRIGISFNRLRLPRPKDIKVRIRCRAGCLEQGPWTNGYVSAQRLRGRRLLKAATLDVEMTRRGWIGRYAILRDAGTENPGETELCLLPGADHPTGCPHRQRREHREAGPETPSSPPSGTPQFSQVPAAVRTAITSLDGTLGDRGPYSGQFTFAAQPFRAASDTVTYLGAVVGNPALAVGPSSEEMTLRLCETAECAGTELAGANARINNYGMSSIDIGDVAVEAGQTYYVVWSPPAADHGASWVAFWHTGTAQISGAREMEAVVRGYESGSGAGRRSVVDYAGGKPPPAPYSGSFGFASQGFKANSDTITEIGAVIGNPKLARGAEGPERLTLRLCESPDCSHGILASATPYIDNYGVTRADIGDIAVNPGATYFVYWQSPSRVEGASWLAFWLGQGPEIQEAKLLEAIATGYDHGSELSAAPGREEQQGYLGAPSFEDPSNASGEGPPVPALAEVEVSCRLYAPQIESVEPDGYWYRLKSSPWDDHYYAAANTFWNGVTPGGSAEAINTDFNVPDCSS